MRRFNKTPIILLLLVAVAYAAVKGLMYLRVKSTMDELVQEAADAAEISYSGISTEITGAAAVEGISIRPLQMEQAIYIERAYFSSDDPLALISGKDWRKEQPPEQMRFAFEGVSLTLDDELIQALREQTQGIDGRSADVCGGDLNNLDPGVLRELGFEELRMEAHMDYHFDVPAERLYASFGFELENIESVNMSVEVDGVIPQDIAESHVTTPGLASAEMSVDLSRNFGDRYMKLCAQRAGTTVDVYRTQLLDRMHRELAQIGVVLGSGLQQAMADLYRDWGELRINLRPAEPLGPMHMFQVTPHNIVDLLGLSLRINGRPVADLSFDFDMQALMTQARVEAETESSSILPPPELPKRVRITRSYQPVPVYSLQEHLGSAVRIKPRGQPVRSGELVAIVGAEAQIRQRAHGGSFTSHVIIADIESVQVQVVERELLEE